MRCPLCLLFRKLLALSRPPASLPNPHMDVTRHGGYTKPYPKGSSTDAQGQC